MNKYITTIRGLKYIGITLVVGYLLMIVTALYKQKDKDISFTERIADATIGALYAYIIYISIFLSNLRYGQNYPYPKL